MDNKDITSIENHNEKEPYDTFENIKTILVFALLGISVALLISDFFSKPRFKDLESRITELETKVNESTVSEDPLDHCPLCGSEVKLYTNEYDGYNSYRIECPNCKLETKNYYAKDKLIEYWNGQISVMEYQMLNPCPYCMPYNYNNINKKEEHE